MTLCSLCEAQKEQDRARNTGILPSGIEASGGWCAPADTIYSLTVGDCHIIQKHSLLYYLIEQGCWYRPKRIRYALDDWKINQEEAGQMAHGYISPNSLSLPDIKAHRGGIHFE